ncbi:MAG TPA: hypothetical protein VMQ51_15330 [Candidatus Binatia bacterium]|nr:hypothetical protein [Candidatus Binatia bacterium]
MASVELVERRPTVDEYRRLIAAVGSIFSVCAEAGGTAVGMGRVIGDSGLH